MKLVIVTGMSGAGKTIALKMLEDIGFYCVDNLPISLVDKFVQLVSEGTNIEKTALGLDIRSGEELGNLDEILENWRSSNVDVQVLFLDANDAVLIKRYKETRRTHPLAGSGRLESGIEKEREKLAFLKKRQIISLTPVCSLPGNCEKNWKRYFCRMQDIKICMLPYCLSALNMEYRKMRIWYLMYVSFQILITMSICALLQVRCRQ